MSSGETVRPSEHLGECCLSLLADIKLVCMSHCNPALLSNWTAGTACMRSSFPFLVAKLHQNDTFIHLPLHSSWELCEEKPICKFPPAVLRDPMLLWPKARRPTEHPSFCLDIAPFTNLALTTLSDCCAYLFVLCQNWKQRKWLQGPVPSRRGTGSWGNFGILGASTSAGWSIYANWKNDMVYYSLMHPICYCTDISS